MEAQTCSSRMASRNRTSITGITGLNSVRSITPCIQHPYVVHTCSDFLRDLTLGHRTSILWYHLSLGLCPIWVGSQVAGRWNSCSTYSGQGPPLSPDPASPGRTVPTMRSIWALWEVSLGTLLPNARGRASVDGVERP